MKSLVVLAVLAAITIQTFEICSASTCNVYMGGKLVIPIYGPLHRYTCCNNCQETNPTCDGKTYQGGSTDSYCGRCGQSTGGGELKTSNVQCINCVTQDDCASMASFYNFPGGCWKWASVFVGCCQGAARNARKRQPLQLREMEFCGDSTCQSDESPTTCPVDCCYQVNSTCVASNRCTPSCCAESTCCQSGSATTKALAILCATMVVFALVILG